MIRNFIALAGLLLVLVAVNASILHKERHLEDGRVVFLELAPVDPRSLMQGDYMALRFSVADKLRNALPKVKRGAHSWWRKVDAEDGFLVVSLDDRGVGTFSGVAGSAQSAQGETNLKFRVRSGTIKFATNAFFFEEGTAERYEQARYGEFRVNEDGELLLVGLRNEALERIESGTSISD